jgi:CarD family transcriptional regulator
MMKLNPGDKIVHSLHGVGNVEKIEEKEILGKLTSFAILSFQEDRLKIMVNVDQRNNMLRPLMNVQQVETVMKHLKDHICATVISKSTQRYNVNLQRIKSGDVTNLAEVIKELSGLLEEKRLTQKEQSMLDQTRRILAAELSQVTNRTEEETLAWIEESVKRQLVSAQ